MTPECVRRVMEMHPELEMAVSDRGDMFSAEQWGAIMSPSVPGGVPVYRYVLWRIVNADLPILLVLMLNPSRATHDHGDRTVDGLMRRAAAMGYGGIVIINCFAYRARDPADMKSAEDPVGPANDDVIKTVLDQEADLLCAWGVNATHRDREREIVCAISSGRAKPHALRLCANGAPEHPLYIPSALGLKPWSVRDQDIGGDAIRP